MRLQQNVGGLFALLICVSIGCGDEPDEKPITNKSGAPAVASTPAADRPTKLNASHILIPHAASQEGNATRTKAEALELAKEISAKAQAKGADFAELAKKHSEGPSGPDGGDLGNFEPGQMVPAFSEATVKLKIGEISGPVESQFGYHIIQRKKLVEDLCASHILIQYAGSSRATESIKRTKEEALKLAKEVARKAQAKDADFAALAKEHSDGPSGPNGGDLGVFAPGQMIKSFSAATVLLKVGQVSDPVESDFGYHVILRKEIPPPPRSVSARHILIQYKGSSRADGSITRTQEQAKTRIDEVVTKLKAGEDFETLAKEYSDGPSGPRGGDLGEFLEGAMHPKFNDSVFGLEVDGTSDIVETPFGYHVIYRYK